MDKPSLKHQDPSVLLVLTASGVVALRSIVSLLFLPIPDRMPPLGFFLILSFVSLGLFKLLQQVRRRRILDIAIFLVGVSLSTVGSLHWSWKGSSGMGWLGVPPLSGFLDWYALCLLVLSISVHWVLGITLSRMDTSHSRILLWFDSGIGLMLFIAFLRWGIKMEDPYSFHMAGLYILFGSIALYRAKRREIVDPFDHPKSLLRSVGAFLSLGGVGLGIALLSFPLLTYSADTLYRAANTLLSPLGPYLIRLLRFLLGFTFARPRELAALSTAMDGPPPTGGEEPAWIRLVANLLGWGSLGALSLLGLVILGLLSKLLIQALLQSQGEGLPFFLILKRLLCELIAHIRAFLNRIATLFKQLWTTSRNSTRARSMDLLSSMDPSLQKFYREVSRSLKSLYRVGRLLGIKRLSSETLRQYVDRLGGRLPRLREPGQVIQQVVEQFWYGSVIELDMTEADVPHLKELRAARRALWVHLPACLPSSWRK